MWILKIIPMLVLLSISISGIKEEFKMAWKIKAPFRGSICSAIYRNPIVDSYKGNPFIEALPPILSEDEAIALMRYRPRYEDSYFTLPAHIRLHYTMDALRYIQPLRRYRALERSISRMLRVGYISRHPVVPGFFPSIDEKVNDFMEALDPKQSYELKNEPTVKINGLAILGISGVGKTTAIERVLSLYPQVIQHRKYHDEIITVDQLVWLKIECPHNGSTKAFLKEFIKEVDGVLGTSYTKGYAKHGATEEDMTGSVARLALVHGLGILVVDELQHLNVAKSGGAEEMMNFFTNFVNKIGVPVVLVGLPDASGFITKEFQTIRRVSGDDPGLWDRMIQDDEWDCFLKGLWQFQYTKYPVKLTEKMSNVLYDQTQGIADLVIKLFVLSQIRAIESNHEKLTPSIIKSAAKDGFALARPVLNALRSNDVEALKNWNDIIIEIDQFFESACNNIDGCKPEDKSKQQLDENLSVVASWLMDGGFCYDDAFSAARQALESLGYDAPIPMLRKEATNYLSNASQDPLSTNNKKSVNRKPTP